MHGRHRLVLVAHDGLGGTRMDAVCTNDDVPADLLASSEENRGLGRILGRFHVSVYPPPSSIRTKPVKKTSIILRT